MNGIKCCYQCENRKQGCHSTCEKYKEEKKALDIYRDALKKEKIQFEYIYQKR